MHNLTVVTVHFLMLPWDLEENTVVWSYGLEPLKTLEPLFLEHSDR